MHEQDSKLYELSGAIMISGNSDGILVPVYTCHPDNSYYVSSTDEEMRVISFYELTSLFDRIIHLRMDFPRTLFSPSDTAPVLLSISGNLEVVRGESVSELIENLEELSTPDAEIVHEAIYDLSLGRESVTERAYRLDGLHSPQWTSDISTKAAKLWLDVAVQPVLLAKNKSTDLEESKVQARLSLLAWARENATHATSPIFDHFVGVTRNAERSGVFVKDILAVALIQRATDSVARKDRVQRSISEFIEQYGHGPLSTVIQLSKHDLAGAANFGSNTLERYYQWVRENALRNFDHEGIVLTTLAANPITEWPDDIRKMMEKYLKALRTQISGLIESRDRLLEKLHVERSGDSRDPWVGYTKREIHQNATKILSSVRAANLLNKSLVPSDTKSFTAESAYAIDFSALGLNRDYFISLERPLESAIEGWEISGQKKLP